MPFGAALSICSEGNFEALLFLFSAEFQKCFDLARIGGKKISAAATAETVKAILYD